MKDLYNREDFEGILQRIETLQSTSERKWGKMDVSQMLAHLNASLETTVGLNFPKRSFLGRIIGKMVKKQFLSDNEIPKNSPTDPNYKIEHSVDYEVEKSKLIKLLNLFYDNGKEKCTKHPHSFFGPMTPEEWSLLQWNHFDHHLRQFGA